MTGLLSAAELASQRAVQTGNLPDTAIISRYTSASDGAGGVTETWAAVGTADCRLASGGLTAAERAVAEKLSAVSTWIVTLPQGTSVTEKDRIAISSRTFEVASVGAWSYESASRALCVEVE